MTIRSKVEGTWTSISKVFAKVEGTWTSISKVFAKVEGTWTQVFSSQVGLPIIQNYAGTTISTQYVGLTLYGYSGSNTTGSYTYAWQYSSDGINNWSNETGTGATGSGSGNTVRRTYVTDLTDDKLYIRFKVFYNGANKYSNVVYITKRTPALNLSSYPSDPVLSGTQAVGSTLSLSSHWITTNTITNDQLPDSYDIYWTDNTGTTHNTWYQGGTANNTYLIPSGALGGAVSVYMTATNSGGTSASTTARTTGTIVDASLTAPTISSVVKSGSNYLVYFSGGSGPYYQVWWNSSTGVGAGYDANGTSSPITVTNLTASSGTTYYFFVRSVSSLGNTGTGPSSTISSWSSYYTYTEPSAVAPTINGSYISPSSGTAGSTTFYAIPGTVTGTPTPTISYQWQYFSNSAFTYYPVSGATSSSYSPPSNFNSIYPNYGFFCLITASNSAGSSAERPSATLNNPVVVTVPITPTGLSITSSGLATWNASSGAASYTINYWLASNSSGANAFNAGTVNVGNTTSYQIPYANNPSTGVYCNYTDARVYASNSAGDSSWSAWYPSASTYV